MNENANLNSPRVKLKAEYLRQLGATMAYEFLRDQEISPQESADLWVMTFTNFDWEDLEIEKIATGSAHYFLGQFFGEKLSIYPAGNLVHFKYGMLQDSIYVFSKFDGHDGATANRIRLAISKSFSAIAEKELTRKLD